jgi:hypothetical protein
VSNKRCKSEHAKKTFEATNLTQPACKDFCNQKMNMKDAKPDGCCSYKAKKCTFYVYDQWRPWGREGGSKSMYCRGKYMLSGNAALRIGVLTFITLLNFFVA